MKRNFWRLFLLAALLTILLGSNAQKPVLPPFPEVPAKQQIDSVKMGDWRTFPEMRLDIPIADGPFEPTWESIEKNYPGEPAWLREAKFGKPSQQFKGRYQRKK